MRVISSAQLNYILKMACIDSSSGDGNYILKMACIDSSSGDDLNISSIVQVMDATHGLKIIKNALIFLSLSNAHMVTHPDTFA